MLTVVAALSLSLIPTDDIWVYSHAGDPQSDVYLRVWGADGVAVPAKTDDIENFGFSYLKFDLSPIPAGAKLISAKLILTHIAKAGFTADLSKKLPLEARALSAEFKEKTWTYDLASKLRPGELYGTAALKPPAEEKEFAVELKLDKEAFLKDFKSAKKVFAIALTTKLSPAEGGQSTIYKFFSKDYTNAAFKPKLKLEFED